MMIQTFILSLGGEILLGVPMGLMFRENKALVAIAFAGYLLQMCAFIV